ncbi:MAG TPA: DUF1844 domain-containing protein [Phycisphaerae bacterium]|nr:DUF1844 domain-containing protein [Phycisphaerae bacterium]
MADQEQQDDKPKIVVDDDWKNQAQAEKQKLAEQGPGAAEAEPEGRQIPPASFATLVGSMLTQVMLALGGIEDPKTKRRYMDLELAKHYIDTLSVLEQKTKGNLDAEETRLLDRGLYEARMQYVQMAQQAGGL